MTLDALCSANDVLIYDTFNAAATSTSFLFGNAGAAAAVGAAPASASPAPPAEPAAEAEEKQQGRRKRRRRTRSCKNREDAESQRMTHIAVERNRRRQMNEYLAVLRSLMPDCYVHRGDQASIVGGAIDFVKELEQLLQSLEAQKRTLMQMQMRTSTSTTTTTTASGMESTSNCTEEACDMGAPPFAQFFTYPQYVWCHAPRESAAGAPPSLAAENRSGVADIEVSLIETHANLRIMSPRRPGQLVKMVAGLQALRLAVLHLNVTTLDSLVLYFISVKVEEGCSLTTVDDIAAAVHHVLCIIGAEAASQQLLAGPSAVTSSDL